MKDYIDRIELRKAMQYTNYVVTKSSCKNNEVDWLERSKVFKVINMIQAEDVVSAKPGRWLDGDDFSIKCSCCGKVFNEALRWYYYCPMCGAKMEVE